MLGLCQELEKEEATVVVGLKGHKIKGAARDRERPVTDESAAKTKQRPGGSGRQGPQAGVAGIPAEARQDEIRAAGQYGADDCPYGGPPVP